MRGRSTKAAACAILLALVAIPLGGAEDGGEIWSVSEPVVNPSPVREGDIATVSFTITMTNHPPCRALPDEYVYSPACVDILAWRISLNGDFAEEDATPLATGHQVYHVETHHAEDGYVTELDIEERVVINAPTGDHTLRLHVVKMVEIPIQHISHGTYSRLVPCGTSSTGVPLDCHSGIKHDVDLQVVSNPTLPSV